MQIELELIKTENDNVAENCTGNKWSQLRKEAFSKKTPSYSPFFDVINKGPKKKITCLHHLLRMLDI